MCKKMLNNLGLSPPPPLSFSRETPLDRIFKLLNVAHKDRRRLLYLKSIN